MTIEIRPGTFIPSPCAVRPAVEAAILNALAAGVIDRATASAMFTAYQPRCITHALPILVVCDNAPCCVECVRGKCKIRHCGRNDVSLRTKGDPPC